MLAELEPAVFSCHGFEIRSGTLRFKFLTSPSSQLLHLVRKREKVDTASDTSVQATVQAGPQAKIIQHMYRGCRLTAEERRTCGRIFLF